MNSLYKVFETELKILLNNKECIYSAKSNASASYSGTDKKFLGIVVPCLRTFAKEFYSKYLKNATISENGTLLNRLFKSSVHEYYKVASEFLGKDKKLLYSLDWDTLFNWLSFAQGWEEIDQYVHMVLSYKFIKDAKDKPKFFEQITPKLINMANSDNLAYKRGVLVILIRPLRDFKDNLELLNKTNDLADKLLELPTYKQRHPPIINKAIKWLKRVKVKDK